MSKKYCLVIGLVCLMAVAAVSSARADYILLNDTFDSAGATRGDDANDAADANWWVVGPDIDDPSTDVFLAADAGGINSGNALNINASGTAGRIWANFPTVSLNNVGDWLELKFDARLPVTSASKTGFRFGVYSTVGTTAPSADKYDDTFYLNDLDGYMLMLGTSTTYTGDSIRLRRETEDGGTATAILSASSADQYNYNVPKGTCTIDTNKHTYSLKLIRTDTGTMGAGMRTIFSLDGSVLSDYTDDGTYGTTGSDPYGFLSTFNGLCLQHAVTGYDYLIDNVEVASNVAPIPEPSTLALLACGLFGLLAYAWRKRK